MAREISVRWSNRDRCWVSDCGEQVDRADGRGTRRRRIYFREDQDGRIPPGQVPKRASWRPVDFPEYSRARAALHRYLADVDARAVKVGELDAFTLAQRYLDRVAALVEKGQLRETTRQGHLWSLNRWCQWIPPGSATPIGDRHARRVNRADLEAWASALLAGGAAPHYAGRMVASVCACWADAARVGDLDVNPLQGVRKPKGPRSTGRTVDREELLRWFRAAWAKARKRAGTQAWWDRLTLLLIRAIADTGCRPGELTTAKWEELDPVAMILRRRDHKTSAKTGKPRTIVFPLRWRRTLALLRVAGHPTLVFPHRAIRPRSSTARRTGDEAGEPWNAAAFAAKMRALGAPCTPYDLRRSWISRAADGGLSYEKIGDLVGNSPAVAREVYSQRAVESLRRDAEAAAKRSPRNG